MGKSERTLKMMDNYVKLHNEGHAPREIANMFGLSYWTVYHHMQEIADEAGVSRESLLKVPHEKPLFYERKADYVEPLDLKKFQAEFNTAMNAMSDNGLMIDMLLEDMDKFESNEEGRTGLCS